MTPQDILCLPLTTGNLSDAKTVGQYLMRLAKKAAIDREVTYPFGNSDWETPLIFAFANADLLWLRTDEFSQIEDYPCAKFDEILQNLYDFLFDAEFSTIVRLLPPPPPKEWYVVYVETGDPHGGLMQDYFKTPYTEDEAKTKADESNEPYDSNPWHAVHIPV
jgi:hypothetical protein